MLPVFPDKLVGTTASNTTTPVFLKYNKESENAASIVYEKLFYIHDPHQAKLRYNAPFTHNMRDYSPNNYTGTASGVTISRNALFSNANTHYFSLASAAFPSGTTDFTIEFNITSLAAPITYPFIINSSVYTASGFYTSIAGTGTGWAGPNNFIFNYGTTIGGGSVRSKSQIRSNRSYHIAIVRKGIKTFLYIDGMLEHHYTDTTVRSLVTSGTPKIWGQPTDTTSADKGYISNVKFYNSAKYTGATIPGFKYRPDLETPSITSIKRFKMYSGPIYIQKDNTDKYYNNLILAAPFNGTYTDYSTKSLAATVSQTSFTKLFGTKNSKNSPSKYQYALNLDGVDDRVIYNIEAIGTRDYTIELFYKPNSTSSTNYGRLVQIGTNANAGGLWIVREATTNPMKFIIQGYTSSAYFNCIPTNLLALDEGKWNHVAVVRLNGITNLFVNGKMVRGYSGYENYSITQTILHIGTNNSLTEEIAGNISDLRVYANVAKYIAPFTVDWKGSDLIKQ